MKKHMLKYIHGASTFAPPFHGCFLVAMWMSDLGHIDTVSRTGGRGGRQTSSTTGGEMSEWKRNKKVSVHPYLEHL